MNNKPYNPWFVETGSTYTSNTGRYINYECVPSPFGNTIILSASDNPIKKCISGEPIKNPSLTNEIENVIFNNPATIVYWADGTKTVVKCQPEDEYCKETGLAMCILKYACGNKGNYNDVFEKWCK